MPYQSDKQRKYFYTQRKKYCSINKNSKECKKWNTLIKKFSLHEQDESLKGGLADNKTLFDIEKLHYPDYSQKYTKEQFKALIYAQLEKGLEIEKEHTNDPKKKKEIALDHLKENPFYYDELEKIENKSLKKENKNMKTLKKILLEKLLLESDEYKNTITAVGILFTPDQKILILQRGSTAPWMPNKWSLVGGVVEDNESILDAFMRECEEEIGMKPINMKSFKKTHTDALGHVHYFIADLPSNNIQLDYENSNFDFVNQENIDDFDYIPEIKDVMLEVLDLKYI